MKKIVSWILIFSTVFSVCNSAYAKKAYTDSVYINVENTDGFLSFNLAEKNVPETCVPDKDKLLEEIQGNSDVEFLDESTKPETYASNFVLNSAMLTSFNTVSIPRFENGANEPKYSYNEFFEEKVSPYSGELTLNFEDLVLEGRNGLNLRIGRTYQSVSTNVGSKNLLVLPDENYIFDYYLVNDNASYLDEKYDLGVGWGFSFPSVQIEKEYEPNDMTDEGIYYTYTEKKQLYYHSGNGDVYTVDFTDDTTDSNLTGYYKKDIQFNKEDNSYTFGDDISYYSMTLADKTKQYFAEDGRLLGIVDRFGNEIKFEYDSYYPTNKIRDGSFVYDDGMWEFSLNEDGTADGSIITNQGRTDQNSAYFGRRNTETTDRYLFSKPIQVDPGTNYKIGISVKGDENTLLKINMQGYNSVYTPTYIQSNTVRNYNNNNWNDYVIDYYTSETERYLVVNIQPDAYGQTYIDDVFLCEEKKRISKITDSIGRTVNFSYSGELNSNGAKGSITLTVKNPDGSVGKTLTYNKEAIEFLTKYAGCKEQRFHWYLSSSETEGNDGVPIYYTYECSNDSEDGDNRFTLYSSYNGYENNDSDSLVYKCVLRKVQYKDRTKNYNYHKVTKRFGPDDGFSQTIRIMHTYDSYATSVDGGSTTKYTGYQNEISYHYTGYYGNIIYNDETGYPNCRFDETTNLGEKWVHNREMYNKETFTTLSNQRLIQEKVMSDDVTYTTDYTYDSVFKDQPSEIKNTVSENDLSKETYILYKYNDEGNVASETLEVEADVKNNDELLEKYTIHYIYDSNFPNFVSEKKWYNNVNSPQVKEIYVYDELGRITQSKNSLKEKVEYFYDSVYPWNVARITQNDPMGFADLLGGDRVIEYTYDSYGLYPVSISRVYDKGVSTESYSYDYLTGNLIKTIYPDGSVLQNTYYSDGKLKQTVYPLTQYDDGRTFRIVEDRAYKTNSYCSNYDSSGNVCEIEIITSSMWFEDTGEKLIYSVDYNFYDAAGNVKMTAKNDFSVQNSDGSYKTVYEKYYYDEFDRVVKFVDRENNEILYEYDGFDRPLTISDSENNKYIYSYDTVNDVTSVYFDGNSEEDNTNIVTEQYDIYGNIVKRTVYPDNTMESTLSESYEYDLNNNVVKYTDPNNNVTQFVYDSKNQLKETIMPDGTKATAFYSSFGEPSFEKIYDTDGNERLGRVSYRNEKGDLTMKFYNFDNRQVKSNGYEVDSKGRIINFYENGKNKIAAYDESDNQILVTSGNSQIQSVYNGFGVVYSKANSNDTSSITYSYDNLGRVTSKIQDRGYKFDNTYSDNGNLTKMVSPSKRQELYSYTPNGNLRTIETDVLTLGYDYYDNGLVKSIFYHDTLQTDYKYDNINRVTEMVTTSIKTNTIINQFNYTYDNNGNMLTETRNGETTAYEYDSLDRLISVIYPDGLKVFYEYDVLNNRTKEIYSNGTEKEYVYNKKYQLENVKVDGKVTDTYTYNKTGALVSHNEKVYTYNEWDKMTGYTDGENSYSYKYDINGIRTAKNDEQYIVDINNNVIAEADENGAVCEEIVYGHQPLARKIVDTWYYYIYNAHGDVVGMTDENGNVVNEYTYDPWGNILSETETVENPIKYAGEYYDEELDMYYLRARYYDPNVGRFTSLDIKEGEISSPLDMNRYVYCRNNPIKYVDPSGESVTLTCIILGAVIGAVVGGAVGGVISLSKYGEVKWQHVVGGMLLGGVSGAIIGWGAGAVVAKFGAGKAALSIINGGGASFETFDKLKQFLGSPGQGNHWHHIVEQCQTYTSRAGFYTKWVQNTNNVVAIPADVHRKISAYYSSIDRTISSTQTVREWLSTKGFQYQYEFGIKVLESFGITVGK